jgi:hypothetical protein
MSPAGGGVETIADERLAEALREALAPARADADAPLRLARRRSPHRSTFPLEELQVELAEAGESRIAFKRLRWERADRRFARPSFLFDPLREPEVYRSVLPRAPAGPPRFIACVQADEREAWLFLEWVEGRELCQVGELSAWKEAARWLGKLHAALAGERERHAARARLLEHDAAYYRGWLERALGFATEAGPAGAVGPAGAGGGAAEAGRAGEAARFLEGLGERYGEVVQALLALPRTVIHGDFHASNVLVGGEPGALRVAPVDWELAAHGPGLIDLAALVSGGWSDEERAEMARAYAGAAGLAGVSPQELDLARLHLAVQWLGWARDWQPPPEQRRDWLAEAQEIAARLGL